MSPLHCGARGLVSTFASKMGAGCSLPLLLIRTLIQETAEDADG